MANHRLFAALRPPAATRAALLATMGGIPGARWQDDGQLHCTLRFIGEVDRHQAEDVAAALGEIRHPAMRLRLGNAGVFECKGRVDTLWIGVKPREAIEPLHLKIDRVLRKARILPDTRAFVPHITIARFARTDAPALEVANRSGALVSYGFEASHFELFESHLGSEGALYETVCRYSLDCA